MLRKIIIVSQNKILNNNVKKNKITRNKLKMSQIFYKNQIKAKSSH